jgi:hypothetical protein
MSMYEKVIDRALYTLGALSIALGLATSLSLLLLL